MDTESGLARVGGSVTVYRKILRQFASSQADAPARIRSALASGDRVTAERAAHTLKGVAGNVGARDVQEAAKRLEAAIQEEVGTDTLIGELEQILGGMVESLSPLTANQDTAGVAVVEGEAADLLPKLDRLQALLEDYDSAAGDLVSEIESQAASTEFARPVRELGERIDDFEFDEAMELLEGLRETIRSSVAGSAVS